jgi:hypothetical protein
VAQGKGPEFKPQYHKNTVPLYNILLSLLVILIGLDYTYEKKHSNIFKRIIKFKVGNSVKSRNKEMQPESNFLFHIMPVSYKK